MRHDPASGAIVIMLRELKMHGMAQAVAELAEQGSPAFEAPMLEATEEAQACLFVVCCGAAATSWASLICARKWSA